MKAKEVGPPREKCRKIHWVLDVGRGARCYNLGYCECGSAPGSVLMGNVGYSLISPLPLQCQNGQQERLLGGFPVDVAHKAMAEIKRAYRVHSVENAAELVGHPAGHVFDVPAAVRLLDAALKARE